MELRERRARASRLAPLASFVIWIAFMGVHVLTHLLRLPRVVTADLRYSERVGGAGMRATLLLGVLGAGVVLAVFTLPLAQSWLNWVESGSG